MNCCHLIIPALVAIAVSGCSNGGPHEHDRDSIGASGTTERVVAEPVPGQRTHTWHTYYNSRFDYSIDYPSDLLEPQKEAENGDGRKFLTSDSTVEMLAYGSNNALEETLSSRYQDELHRYGDSVTYKVLRDSWFVISGSSDNHIFYKKTMLANDVFITFSITYPDDRNNHLDSIVARISRSLHIGDFPPIG